jgi:hypothetical protein
MILAHANVQIDKYYLAPIYLNIYLRNISCK